MENKHIWNSFILMENVHMCKLSHKGPLPPPPPHPRSGVGENLHCFLFCEKVSKKIIIFSLHDN